jgi:hypothetical protein
MSSNNGNSVRSGSLSVPHYTAPPLPISFSKNLGSSSNNGMYREGRMSQMSKNNEYLLAPLFKNESNFLTHEYAES